MKKKNKEENETTKIVKNEDDLESKEESDIKLSVILEKSEEYSSSSLAISVRKKEEEGLSDEKKLEIMDSLIIRDKGKKYL